MDESTTIEQLVSQMAQSDDPELQEGDPAQPEGEANSAVQPAGEQDDDPQDDPDGSSDDNPAAASPDDQVIEWETSSGEKFSAPVAELKAGYMRNQDYTHKTQELARERDSFNERVQQQFQQVQQFAQALGELHVQDRIVKQLEANIAQINRYDDPTGYSSAVSELMMATKQRDGLAAHLQTVQQARTQEQHQAFLAAQKQAAAELSTGPNAIPGFGKELVQKLNVTGRDYGFSPEEMSTITDPRHIRVLHDAMKYRELQAKKPEAMKKVAAAPKPAPQTRSVPPNTVQKAAKSFAAKPSIEAMAVLMNAANK
ncbi:hypothetical protein [Achromobacter xylosoxidans]|uniref:Uncharacterized protein n=1 Tax=Alcaligenes xylosoxydans xylosoxydans TaxID=85698 RepID=A0A1R1JSD2_ALCXX|nr:hypothetical protein [Achromobacter xylosoxidans]OMG85398.1 hypothetical protein BIZ92_27005 [Achromobacter xylosoxidans]